MTAAKPTTVDAYIANFPQEVQILLMQVRSTIKQVAPNAEERISYGMPGYYLHGQLVFFAAFKNHIGFYATPTGHEAFAEELARFKQGKGSVQFPLKQPIPFDLIKRIVEFRVKEQMRK
jgi:uncharacterized protein YdhG (YjbR/CyaY superfamily)